MTTVLLISGETVDVCDSDLPSFFKRNEWLIRASWQGMKGFVVPYIDKSEVELVSGYLELQS